MTTLYGIRNCDTMRKARAWLDAHRVPYGFHDYARAGIDRATVDRWIAEMGWEGLLNRSGTTFRKLPEAERLGIDAGRAAAIMVAHPSAIRRPVLDTGAVRIVGFRPDWYAEVFP